MVAVSVEGVSWRLSRRVRASLNYGNYNQKCVLSAVACVKERAGGRRGQRVSHSCLYRSRSITSETSACQASSSLAALG